MATNKSVREGTKIVFADGIEREVFPVSIRNMRKMMKIMKELEGVEDGNVNDDQLNVMIDAARVVLDDVDPKLVAKSRAAVEKREALLIEGKEEEAEEVEDPLEDVLDISTVNRVLGAGMGADPNV